ncbi:MULTISPECIES: antitoxin HicB [unclassified Rathayibacter]|uniref:antitoxin HicB n=1 Tax=unclassified Rathayibacter TaxID=2609250 RepID=UPI000CE8321C|nr:MULTISPECIES: antitoxin HicB [unclassified Rathayibacter]PPF25750.1 antitoxin HicB [Rathayibacter sp. AY1F2]PPH43695.1 antitoxin HicB [Rathayibacter sp. AY1F7]
MTTTEQTRTSQRSFEAIVTREGRWWMIAVPALDAVTQARSIKEVQFMATELVAALLNVEPDQVSVNLTYELPATVASTWREAEALRAQAEDAEERAAALRRDAVRALLAETHMSQTEAGVVLGLSKQRVQQLAS